MIVHRNGLKTHLSNYKVTVIDLIEGLDYINRQISALTEAKANMEKLISDNISS
jgi:hypothetical protein